MPSQNQTTSLSQIEMNNLVGEEPTEEQIMEQRIAAAKETCRQRRMATYFALVVYLVLALRKRAKEQQAVVKAGCSSGIVAARIISWKTLKSSFKHREIIVHGPIKPTTIHAITIFVDIIHRCNIVNPIDTNAQEQMTKVNNLYARILSDVSKIPSDGL